MNSQNDLDLDLAKRPDPRYPDGDGPPGDDSGRRVTAVVVAVVVALLAVAVWFWWQRDAGEEAPLTAQAGEAGTEATLPTPADPLGAGEAIDLPPLGGELDPVVRSMLGTLSARPELARLLATDDLVRRFVTSVDNIGRGRSPSRHLVVLRPDGTFSVERPQQAGSVPAATFARYDGAAATVANLDAAAMAKVYGSLRPRLNEAYAELGDPSASFDAAMERAIVHLLSVSPDAARGQVQPGKGLTYQWSDANTENLSSAQKQLLRMGPENAERVQQKLRELALALGIPAERLPS